MRKAKMSAEETMQLAFEQMQEDRETIKASYDEFSKQMAGLNDYAVNGANINKCLELLTKQTAQLLELAKLQGGGKKSDHGLTEDDQKEIYAGLKDVSKINGNK